MKKLVNQRIIRNYLNKYPLTNKALEKLKDIDPLNVTPMQAMNILYELKELSKE